ncbi:MAG: cation-translocating P-type ATPase [Lactobacillus kefiranofaciens]
MHGLFAVTPLTGNQLLWIIGLAVIPTVIIQIVKVVNENR